MGRIRTVKPELFLHEDLHELETELKLPVRVAFIGLFTQADREGRFPWKPKRLRAAILPYDQADFGEILDALDASGFVQKYEADGRTWGWIPSWRKHQVINNRERPSEIPSPPKSTTSPRVPSRVPHARTTPVQGKGKEGKGKEGKGVRTQSVRKPTARVKYSEAFDRVWNFWRTHPAHSLCGGAGPGDKKPSAPFWPGDDHADLVELGAANYLQDKLNSGSKTLHFERFLKRGLWEEWADREPMQYRDGKPLHVSERLLLEVFEESDNADERARGEGLPGNTDKLLSPGDPPPPQPEDLDPDFPRF